MAVYDLLTPLESMFHVGGLAGQAALTEALSAILQIVVLNVLLGGDNAVAIAMACQRLPRQQRRRAIWMGSGAGVVLRIVMIGVIGVLLGFPWMHAIAAALLMWVAWQLSIEDEEIEIVPQGADRYRDDRAVAAGRRQSRAVWHAVGMVVVADVTMSLDNALATGGIAQGVPESWRFAVISIGLAAGIPFMAFGSAVMLHLLGRYPFIRNLGAALLGWVAGGLLMGEPTVRALWVGAVGDGHARGMSVTLAVLFMFLGWFRSRHRRAVESQ